MVPRSRHSLAAPEDVYVLLHVRLGEGDGAALPLRPADAHRLEDLPAAEPGVRRSPVRMADVYEVRLKHWIKFFILREFVQAQALTLKYFFKPLPTINYA